MIVRGIAVRCDRMIQQQRLVSSEIAVYQSLHHVAVRKRIDSLLSSQLLDTKETVFTGVAVERLGNKAPARDERRSRRRIPVDVEFVHLEPVRGETEMGILDLHYVLRGVVRR